MFGIFITQMELVPGYNWDAEFNKYPSDLNIQLTGDLNSDGNPDIISNSYTRSIWSNDLARITYNITRHSRNRILLIQCNFTIIRFPSNF